MDYTINGIPLHDPDGRGWIVTSETPWTAGTTINRPELALAGFDGQVEMDGVEASPALTLVIATPESSLAALRTLFRSGDLTFGVAGTDRTGLAQLRSMTEERAGISDNPDFKVTVALSFPLVWLRGTETITKVPLDAATKTVSVFPGLTGKVSDALIRVTGVTTFKVKDAAGSWFSYPGVTNPGIQLLFDSATARAFIVQDSWAPSSGAEVTDQISTGPGPYALRVTPSFTDPSSTRGKLTVTSANQDVDAYIEIKGRAAYVL